MNSSPLPQDALLDEAQVTLSFQDWLASVTERIHQTMHYQFDGTPLNADVTEAAFSLEWMTFRETLKQPRVRACGRRELLTVGRYLPPSPHLTSQPHPGINCILPMRKQALRSL
ncbi:hypothetical protein H8959_012952 [Pygathrix nigripes]